MIQGLDVFGLIIKPKVPVLFQSFITRHGEVSTHHQPEHLSDCPDGLHQLLHFAICLLSRYRYYQFIAAKLKQDKDTP